MRDLGEKKFQVYTKGNMDTVACALLICISLCSISASTSAAVHSRNGYSDALQLEDKLPSFIANDHASLDPAVACRDACEYLPGVSCTFVGGVGPRCYCDGDNMEFVPEEEGCGETCGKDKMCFNGGTCESGKVCACPDGTDGVSCEIVEECEDKDCGTEAKCRWDIYRKGAVCRCNNKTLSFNSNDKKCKETCSRVRSKCLNDGKCESTGGGNFCTCPEGIVGFFCETITACRGKDCGTDAKCEMDVDKNVAVCKCDEVHMKFDEKDKKCKETCDGDDKYCMYGGKCNGMFCSCPDGTGGSFCEIVPACVDRKVDCGSEAECVKASLEKGSTQVECRCVNSGLTFDDSDKKCKVSLKPFYTVLIVVSAIVGVSLITGAIIYFIKKRQRR